MSHRRIIGWYAALSTAIVLIAAPAAAQQSCETLSGLRLPHTTITLAKAVSAGQFTPSSSDAPAHPFDVPAFCEVEGVITPTPDSDIKFAVWMPATGWNGRFQQLGNAGYAGVIQYPLLVLELRRGYATASTDDGHTGTGDPTWAFHHPEKVIDFGYRAVHLTAENAKAIVQAFYGRPAERSYFAGCSDGGREALMEAQRFPGDFDGIMAGEPSNFATHLFAGFVWNEQATLDNRASTVPANKLPLIEAGALATCAFPL